MIARAHPDVRIYNVDNVRGMATAAADGMRDLLDADSVHLCVTSIPFGALFMYSGKQEDIGNNADGVELDEGQFGLHMRFHIAQLFRVMKPGGIVAIHLQQLLMWKVQHGAIGRRDLRAAVRKLYQAGGFEWKGEIVIPKDPQVIARRLKLYSLQFATGRKDARSLAPAVNDYICILRKPGDDETPVRAMYHEEENPGGWLTSAEWVRDAHGGWWQGIRETDVLEGSRAGREDGDEKHICPFQLTLVRRLVRLYTNPGETVLDPFMGIGSSAVVAMEPRIAIGTGEMLPGCNVVGFELKETYHGLSLRNVARAQAGLQHTDAVKTWLQGEQKSGSWLGTLRPAVQADSLSLFAGV
jgi:DNA modification methylase